MNTLRRVIAAIERSETSFGLWLVAFSSLILTRLLIESWLFGFESRPLPFLFFEWTHNFLFFLLSFLLFLPLFQHFARVPLRVASNMLLFGFLVILSPPIIDFLISNGKGLWSFYIFDGLPGLFSRYFTFFGDRPDMGITYGVRVEVALVTLLFGLYVFLKTKKIHQAFLASLSAYTILFVLGTFPSWAAILIEGISTGRWFLRAPDVAAVFLSPLSLFSHPLADPRSILNAKMSLVYAALIPIFLFIWLPLREKSLFMALYRNARLPQAFYHAGLLGLGVGLAVIFANAPISFGIFDTLAMLSLLIAVISAWLASVVVNDFFDTAIDRETNPTRPLPSNAIVRSLYAGIGAGFFATSLIFSALVSFKCSLLLLLYQALAWGYSAPPFRLKRFPLVASFASAVASVLVLVLGFTATAPDGTLHALPSSFVTLFLFAYTVAIPLKDFKDIAGDRHDGVWTLPALFGTERAKLFIGSGIFFSYLTSVFVFHATALFFPALVFGGASFWIVSLMNEKIGRITYRSIFWHILALAMGYGFLAAGMIL